MRNSILSDALEAIIGAIYLDGGVEICRTRVLAWYEHHLDALLIKMPQKDAKTRLQEYCQSHGFPLPQYEILEILGEAHEPIFKVQCRISAIARSFIGQATVRRKAEQSAAEAALEELKKGV
jgi:ribonuclease-3